MYFPTSWIWSQKGVNLLCFHFVMYRWKFIYHYTWHPSAFVRIDKNQSLIIFEKLDSLSSITMPHVPFPKILFIFLYIFFFQINSHKSLFPLYLSLQALRGLPAKVSSGRSSNWSGGEEFKVTFDVSELNLGGFMRWAATKP